MIRDSLGVPLEPEDNVVAHDWCGDDLYEDDSVYLTEDGLVREEDMITYLGFVYGAPMSVSEYMFIKKEG